MTSRLTFAIVALVGAVLVAMLAVGRGGDAGIATASPPMAAESAGQGALPPASTRVADSAAQTMRPPPKSKGRTLLDLYKEKHAGRGDEGWLAIDAVYFAGLEPTRENLNEILNLLKRRDITANERATLARMLSRFFHSQSDSLGANEVVLRTLEALATTPGNGQAGTTAAIEYSRMGYQPETSAILSKARELGYLDDDAYHGELAHLLRYSPADVQRRFVERIDASGSEYALDILASGCVHPAQLSDYPPETLAAIKSALARHPPKPLPEGAYGLMWAIGASDWLQAMALLTSSGSEAKYDAFVLDVLNHPKTDPRQVIAFLDRYGEALMTRMGRDGRLAAALQRIEAYSEEHPENVTMRNAVAEIQANFPRHSAAPR